MVRKFSDLLVRSSGSKLIGPSIKNFVQSFLVRLRSYFLVENYLFLPTAQTFWSGPVRFMVRSLKSVSKLC